MINVYVVWAYDGPIMTTLLQYEADDMQRQAMQQWSTFDYIQQAFDAEFGEPMPDGASYELAAIFTADNLHFIY
jgi:hypothetical protein